MVVALQWHKIFILVNQSGHLYATGTLRPTMVAQLFFSGGPANNILGGRPCQQLLTLLTLKSAYVPNIPTRIDFPTSPTSSLAKTITII